MKGILTSLAVSIESNAPNNNCFVEVQLEDSYNSKKAFLFSGYVRTGSEPRGNGALPIAEADWQFKITSRSAVSPATTIKLVGTIIIFGKRTGGWTGTDQKYEDAYTIRSIAGTDPAVNTEVSEAVPTGAEWEILTVRAQLVASATAANRNIGWLRTDGTNSFVEFVNAVNQTASQTRNYNFGREIPTSTIAYDSNELWIQMIDDRFGMDTAYIFTTRTVSRQQSDNWGAPRLWVKERLRP